MTSARELTALDRAELEVNRVLEQIGRIFAATNASQNGTALAIATRMKQLLPGSANQFHNALDELDQQLQLAKSIMRRDLALFNQDPTKQLESIQGENPLQINANAQPVSAIDAPKPDSTPDGIATDVPDVTLNATTEGQADPTATEPTGEQQQQATKTDAELEESKTNGDVDAEMKDLPTAQQPLRVHTDQAPSGDVGTASSDAAQKAPDTAFSANADMDSLFDDPLTAGGHGDDQGTNNVLDFTNDTNETNDFDFGVFDTDLGSNNELNLQNYTDTNGNTEAEPDFSALFSGTTGQDGLMSTEAQADGQQLDSAQDIFNFDEMMDIGITNDDNKAAEGDQPEEEFTIDLS